MRTFPIFVDVENRSPLIVGATDLAVIKARLVAKRANIIDVSADERNEALGELAAAGKVRLVPSKPGAEALRGRPFVIAATNDDSENARVSNLARELGVPVNVPDRPELCTFALGAIVDRGDLTVAIGTEGLAPMLATRLRAWLEQELHPRLGVLARVAGEFRNRVADALPPGPARRRFWERVLGGDAARAVLDGSEEEARSIIVGAIANSESTRARPPRVLLVGAGPGDPELLTLRGVRALKAADVILYDELVDRSILDHARREAHLIHVGKRAGQPSWMQADIHKLILKHASEGQMIVRLKGGDPFVFGRGGEEVAALRAAGIEVEVIPGITAAVAAAASTQIPLTHRALSRTVTFLSGAGPGHGLPDFAHIDLEALSDGQHTIAVYMGIRTSRSLGRALIGAGWDHDTPVLAVENASRPTERRVRATVRELAGCPESLGLKSPAILLIGRVAGLPVDGQLDVVERVLEEIPEREPAYA